MTDQSKFFFVVQKYSRTHCCHSQECCPRVCNIWVLLPKVSGLCVENRWWLFVWRADCVVHWQCGTTMRHKNCLVILLLVKRKKFVSFHIPESKVYTKHIARCLTSHSEPTVSLQNTRNFFLFIFYQLHILFLKCFNFLIYWSIFDHLISYRHLFNKK